MVKSKFKPKPARPKKKRRQRKDEQALRELERIRVKRKLRIMAKDKRGYGREVDNVLRKQNKEIRVLESENGEMLNSLTVSYGPMLLRTDIIRTAILKDTVEVKDDYISLLTMEEHASDLLDVKALTLNEQIFEVQRTLGGFTKERAVAIKTVRVITILENTLNRLTKSFCKQLSVNAELREDIRLLVKQKKRFGTLYSSLTKRIACYKRRIINLTDEASSNYEQRLTALSKMKTLKDRSNKDESSFLSEMKVLQRLITHDEHMRKFMLIKENERLEVKADEAAKRAKMCLEEKALTEENQHLQVYEALFDEVKNFTGTSNIDKVVINFTDKEDENFGRFGYVSQLNYQVVKIKEEIQVVRNNIKRLREEDEHSRTGCELLLQQLAEKRKKLEKIVERESLRWSKTNEKLESVCTAIHGLFKAVGCNNDQFVSQLSYVDKITASNVMTYIGFIERKCLELILIQQFIGLHQDAFGNLLTAPRSVHRIRVRGTSKIMLKIPDAPPLPNIITPSVGDEVSDGDESSPCLPRDVSAIREMAQSRVIKKEAGGNLYHQQMYMTDKRLKSKRAQQNPLPASTSGGKKK